MPNLNNKLLFFIILAIACAIQGCGGYGHMNGKKAVEIMQDELIELGLCKTSKECYEKGIVSYGEGIDSLHLYVHADVTIDQTAEIMASIIKGLPPGTIKVQFIGANNKKTIVDLTVREEK